MSDGTATVGSTVPSTVTSTVRSLVAPRRILTLALLIGAWCALWGAVSIANVLAGLIVGVAVTVAAGIQPGAGRMRMIPLLHFIWLVAADLVVSTLSVAWEILTPTDYTDEAIIAVDTSIDAGAHLLMLVVAITVTPGTAVVDTDADTGRLYLHLLHADKADDIVEHVQRLADLACRALPIDPTSIAADTGLADTGPADTGPADTGEVAS